MKQVCIKKLPTLVEKDYDFLLSVLEDGATHCKAIGNANRVEQIADLIELIKGGVGTDRLPG